MILPGQRDSLKAVVAKGLREFPTPCEAKIKPIMDKFDLLSQKCALGFIPDYSNRLRKIAVEIDGAIHSTPEQMKADACRDQAFRRNGWIILHFTNDQVERTPEVIEAALKRFFRPLSVEEQRRLYYRDDPSVKALRKASRKASQRAANLHHHAAIFKNQVEKLVAVSPVKAADRPR